MLGARDGKKIAKFPEEGKVKEHSRNCHRTREGRAIVTKGTGARVTEVRGWGWAGVGAYGVFKGRKEVGMFSK